MVVHELFVRLAPRLQRWHRGCYETEELALDMAPGIDGRGIRRIEQYEVQGEEPVGDPPETLVHVWLDRGPLEPELIGVWYTALEALAWVDATSVHARNDVYLTGEIVAYEPEEE